MPPKKKATPLNPHRHPDGHALVDGARWHYPKQGEPTVCAIEGCDYELGAWRNHDPFDDIEADDDEADDDGA